LGTCRPYFRKKAHDAASAEAAKSPLPQAILLLLI
jgi:hypothetical protein